MQYAGALVCGFLTHRWSPTKSIIDMSEPIPHENKQPLLPRAGGVRAAASLVTVPSVDQSPAMRLLPIVLSLVAGIPADQVRMGMRVKAAWKPREEWGATIQNIRWFEPTGEPDASFESIKDYM